MTGRGNPGTPSPYRTSRWGEGCGEGQVRVAKVAATSLRLSAIASLLFQPACRLGQAFQRDPTLRGQNLWLLGRAEGLGPTTRIGHRGVMAAADAGDFLLTNGQFYRRWPMRSTPIRQAATGSRRLMTANVFRCETPAIVADQRVYAGGHVQVIASGGRFRRSRSQAPQRTEASRACPPAHELLSNCLDQKACRHRPM